MRCLRGPRGCDHVVTRSASALRQGDERAAFPRVASSGSRQKALPRASGLPARDAGASKKAAGPADTAPAAGRRRQNPPAGREQTRGRAEGVLKSRRAGRTGAPVAAFPNSTRGPPRAATTRRRGLADGGGRSWTRKGERRAGLCALFEAVCNGVRRRKRESRDHSRKTDQATNPQHNNGRAAAEATRAASAGFRKPRRTSTKGPQPRKHERECAPRVGLRATDRR